jgi:5-methylcytosine-specific restriction endonuclease McrA
MNAGSMNGSSWIRKNKRLALNLRDGFKCAYCGKDLKDSSPRDVTLDHLLPRSCGGSNEATNLITACLRCNSQRGNRPYADYATGGAIDRIEQLRYSPLNMVLANAILAGRTGDVQVEGLR